LLSNATCTATSSGKRTVSILDGQHRVGALEILLKQEVGAFTIVHFIAYLNLRLNRGISMVFSVVAGDKISQLRLIKRFSVSPWQKVLSAKDHGGALHVESS